MPANKGLVDPLLFQLMVEQARDYALFILDKDGRVMTWNAGAQRIKGYAPEEIIGRHFSTFYTREALDSGWPAHELKVAAAEGHFEDEGWRVRKDGSRFWANVVITALRDEGGRHVGYSKITRDLTDRRLHEDALRQSEERFRVLVEGVVDYAIFMLDPDGVVSSWNQGAERINGYRREEILGKHFSRFYPREDAEAGRPWEELARARRDGRVEAQGWRVRKGGERYWVRAVVTALHDDYGRLRGFAKVTQDMTQQRHLQDLETATRNINEFLATLAHELRNPLAPIRAAVQAMAMAPADDPAQGMLRETIDRQSRQLARIVDDMMDIARITRGVVDIEQGRIELAEVARRALEAAAPLMEEARHQITVDLPADSVTVDGDVDRLTQVVTNLLNNAARYTPQGGAITLSVRAEGGQAVLRVRDNGRGIEPQNLERIFEMFVRGRVPRAAGGLGIGLALSRRLAERHGGTLEAHSEGPDKGSVFTLRLPLAEALTAYAAPRAAAPVVRPGVARRVLVVDDNVDAAATLDMVLRSLGHESRVVNDGFAALAAVSEFRPDAVLLDIGMPGLDGYEVARRLRAMQRGTELRIIAITGWGQEADRVKSRAAGFDVHLVKPVEPADLAQVLH
jgi:PAS domain S-box-containing protein